MHFLASFKYKESLVFLLQENKITEVLQLRFVVLGLFVLFLADGQTSSFPKASRIRANLDRQDSK